VKQAKPTQQIHAAVNEGWTEAGSFLNSILAGTLVGALLDMWLGTDPWLVVIGAVVGAYSGFVNMWHYSKKIEDHPRAR
jgi:F0F1-type ATP synthase assembly protein I